MLSFEDNIYTAGVVAGYRMCCTEHAGNGARHYVIM